jgi:replicative DNA helicase
MMPHPQSEGKLDRPIPLPVNFDSIPPQLRDAPHWVVWKYTADLDAETGEVAWDKPPCNARTGGLASSTNKQTWSSFAVAQDAYGRGGWDGVGFCLDPGHPGPEDDYLIAVDLDHCRDAETGEVEPWASAVVDKLNSYTEASPSGTGLRILLLGRLPPQDRKLGHFECYCAGRYVTVTGARLIGPSAQVERRRAQMEAVHTEVFASRRREREEAQAGVRSAAGGNGARHGTRDLTDLELLDLARAAKNGVAFSRLYDQGDLSGYPSRSEADLALANHLVFWCGRGHDDRADELFRGSALFRSKWNRADYRERTFRKAHAGRSDYYARRPRAHEGQGAASHAHARQGEPEGEPEPFELIDSATFNQRSYRQEWDIRQVLVRGQPCVIGGPRKSLKTSFMIDMAVSLGSGQPFLGVFEVPRPTRVGIVSGENGEAVLQETFRRVCRSRRVDPDEVTVFWGFRLPQLADPGHLARLRATVLRHRLDHLMLDPLYLTLLAGVGSDGPQASNIYQIGPLLMNFASACLDAGCTPILAHHFRQTRIDAFGEPQLEDLSYAGVQEFARQWVLLSRREKYVPGSGHHKVWLSVGGSAGHSHLAALDIDEGSISDDFTGRHWSVSVQSPTEARQCAESERKRKRAEKVALENAEADLGFLKALDAIDPDRCGVSVKAVREESGFGAAKVNRCIDRLVEAGAVERVPVVVPRGKGTTNAQGVRRAEE